MNTHLDMSSWAFRLAVVGSLWACAKGEVDAVQPPPGSEVEAVRVLPDEIVLVPGDRQAFTAQASVDGEWQALTASWSSTAGSISSAGEITAPAEAGNYLVVGRDAPSGFADSALVSVVIPTPPDAKADPTLLPVAVSPGIQPNLTAYAALNVPSRGSGWSYADPTTGVRVWKVTTATVPAANSTGTHDYSEGGHEISYPWGANGDWYTIKVNLQGGGHWLVDYQRGIGFSNWRRPVRGPSGDLAWSFSSNPATPQLAYVISGQSLYRINTATNTQVDGGGFPRGDTFFGAPWLSVSRGDQWFTWMEQGNQYAAAWNAQTGVRRRSPRTTNEIRLSADGEWALLAGEPSQWWRLSDGALSTNVQPRPVHLATLRGGMGVAANVDDAIPPDFFRLQAGLTATNVNISNTGFAGYNYHGSGNWFISDADLGGDFTKQWALFGSYNQGPNATGFPVNDPRHKLQNAMGFIRLDGSEQRLLAHTYSPWNGQYWQIPLSKVSPDGRVVLFNSSMQLSGRGDLFLIDVPSR